MLEIVTREPPYIGIDNARNFDVNHNLHIAFAYMSSFNSYTGVIGVSVTVSVPLEKLSEENRRSQSP